MSDWVYVIFTVVGLTAVGRVLYLFARGGWMAALRDQEDSEVYFANERHGGWDRKYRFNYKRVYDSNFGCYSWRAYILRMPSLEGRDPDLHKTHRFTNGSGQYWVCWDRAVETKKDVQAISHVWADSIQEYIATGKRFG